MSHNKHPDRGMTLHVIQTPSATNDLVSLLLCICRYSDHVISMVATWTVSVPSITYLDDSPTVYHLFGILYPRILYIVCMWPSLPFKMRTTVAHPACTLSIISYDRHSLSTRSIMSSYQNHTAGGDRVTTYPVPVANSCAEHRTRPRDHVPALAPDRTRQCTAL